MVIIIGATGFLGKPVLEKLLKKGFKARCLLRTSSDTSKLEEAANKIGGKFGFVTGTLQSPDSIITPLKKAEIAVYMVDLEYTGLLKNFINAALRAGLKRVIFISSTTVLVPLESKVKTKKIASENLIKNSGLDYTILRPSMIYGSKDDTNFSRMINFIKKRGFFITFGSGNNLIQPVYIEDVAAAVVSAIDNRKTFRQIYNIAGKEPLKYNDMLEIVRNKLNKQFKSIRVPPVPGKFLISIYAGISKSPALTPAQIDRTGIDKIYSYRKASNDFDFSPIGFEEGIEKLIKELE
ncbi:MAG: NAD(P)H-binding protein [Actinomycetota bacterium]|nr:NAD(P)H-binding protein [Actinomycetota bacterium]